MSARPLSLLCVLLAGPLCSCDFSDPLSVSDNGGGIEMVDSKTGSDGSGRTICLRAERSRTSCSSRSSEVYISDVPRFGQLRAEWRSGDPQIVDLFLFGGTVERCRPLSRDGGVRIILRQLPLSRMPAPGGGSWDSIPQLFEGEPDRCGATA